MASSGNFANLNIVYRGARGTSSNFYGIIEEGNANLRSRSSNDALQICTFEGLKTGKWYWEWSLISPGGDRLMHSGAADSRRDQWNYAAASATYGAEKSIHFHTYNQIVEKNGTDTGVYSSSSSSHSDDDVFGIALDTDNGKFYVHKNGTYYASGNPATGANPGATWTVASEYTEGFTPYFTASGGTDATGHINFGQDSTFGGRVTAGGNADGNGFGDFKYAPPTGFLAVCSANLPIDSNIDAAKTDDDHPVKVCNAVAYTGTGSARTVSGFGFQPDMVWIKNRASPGDQAHRIVDSSRGVSKAMIPEDTQVENTETTAIQAFNSDGFTIGSALGGYNTSTGTYIAWGWKANGGTTSTNTSGTVTTTVQASTAGGFSILTYTGGNGSWGSTNQDTIGHGLSAAPEFMLFKERNATDAWTVFHHSVGAGGGTTAAHNNLRLDTNDALYTNQSYKSFGGVMPTSTVVTIEGNTTNESTSNHIAYCWHGVEGYSKFGAYEGNNNNDGVFVYTGFRPRIIFLKAIDQSGEWVVYDTARNVNNPVDSVLNWDTSVAESANDSTRAIDVLANGFKIRTSNITINNTNTFVFGAWGDVSFKYSNTHAQ